jgi:8-oxo-dGTP pyrophosphatase MutT (NUDIX family)
MIDQSRTVQTFEVSLKAALFHEGRLLLLQEADTGYWELPGGRIDVGEEWQAHDQILARELREELGPDVCVSWTPLCDTLTRQRPTDGVFQFLSVRVAHYRGGVIRLSSEHKALLWADQPAAGTLDFPPGSGYADAVTRLFLSQA